MNDEDVMNEDDYCEILNDRCPYDYPCSLCLLSREYEAAKEYVAHLGDVDRKRNKL